MRIEFTFVGYSGPQIENKLVDLDAVPRLNEEVGFPGLDDVQSFVRTVIWHPLGSPERGFDSPFSGPYVYIVLRPRRP